MVKIKKETILSQLRINAIAIISLATALIGFSYNTWRDHRNEINDNMRNASFEVLKSLGELQTIVNYAHYANDKTRGNLFDGWGQVIFIRDLCRLLPPEISKKGDQLYVKWEQNWEKLGTDNSSEEKISAEIALTRQVVVKTIDSLE